MLGLDLRGRRIRAVAMRKTSGRAGGFGCRGRSATRWEYVATADVPCPAEAGDMVQALSDRVHPMLRDLPRKQRHVVLCVPTAIMLTHTTKVPGTFSDDDLQALIAADSLQWLGCEPSSLLLDYVLTGAAADAMTQRGRTGSVTDHVTMHVFACREQQLQPWLNICRGAGLRPAVLDIEGLALPRLCQKSGAVQTQRLFLDLDAEGISVHLTADQMLRFSRHFPMRYASAGPVEVSTGMHKSRKNRPESAAGGEIAAELARILQRVALHADVSKVTEVLVMGDYASSRAVLAPLDALGLQVTVAVRPELAIAAAAAMRQSLTGSQLTLA